MIKTICILIMVTISILVTSCGGNNNSICTGNLDNLPNDICFSEFFLITSFAGVTTCEQCTSDIRNEEFSLIFNANLSPVDGEYITVFNIFDTTYFTDDSDCDAIGLLEENEGALEPVGSLQNILITQPDNLSFSMNIDGTTEESISCDFCYHGLRPLCDEVTMGEDCETLEELSNSECLAESLINSCESYFCFSVLGHVGLNPSGSQIEESCEAIDCNTLECKQINTNLGGNPGANRPGILIDLELQEGGEVKAKIIVDNIEDDIVCSLPAVQ